MATLDQLLQQRKGGFVPGLAPVSAGGSKLDKLIAERKAPKQTAPPAPTSVGASSIPRTTTISPTPQIPTTPQKPSILSRVGNVISKAIAPPTQEEAGAIKSDTIRTLRYLPSELVRNLPLGVGETIKQIQDDPQTAVQITGKDVIKEVPGAVLDTARAFGRAALSYPLTLYGATSRYVNPQIGLGPAPGASSTGAVEPNIPLLGPTPNLQARVEQGVESGYLRDRPDQNVLEALETGAKVAGYTGEELLNALFTASLANIPFAARPTTIAKTPGPIPGVAVKQPPRSFRLYEAPLATKPLTPEVVQKLIDSGVPVKNFDPSLPTYFKLKGTGAGGATGEIVQLKPSYFNTFVNQFKQNINKVPQKELILLGEVAQPKPGSVEQIIETKLGFKPGNKVRFDTALAKKDAATIRQMLPEVPKEYQTRFAKEIAAIVPVEPTPKPATIVPPVVTPRVAEVPPKPVTPEPVPEVSTPPKPVVSPEVTLAKPTVAPAPAPIEKPVVEEAPKVQPTKKPEVITVKPEVIKKVDKFEGVPSLGKKVEPLVIKDEIVERPEQLVTKTDLRNILKNDKKDRIDMKVVEEDGKLFMKYDTSTSKTKIRPSALGLVEKHIKPGDTIRVDAAILKEPGTSLRGVGTGGGILASRGSQPIDTFESRIGEKGKPEAKDLKLFEKVEELVRKYAKRVGEGYLPRGTRGVYHTDTENIRLKGMNDLSLAAHEITHAIDLTRNISKDIMKVTGQSVTGNPIYDKATAPLRKEITDLYVNHYPGGKPDHELHKRVVEGFATLLQKYTEMPKTIEQNYPNLVKEFLKPGGKYYNPVVGEILKDLATIVEDYQALAPLDKVGARVTSDHNATGKESFLTGEELIRTEIADEVYPIEKLAKQAGVEMTKDDPSLWIRQYNNTSSIFSNNTLGKRGYWTYENGEFVKRLDENWGSLLKRLDREQKFDIFNNYLVARDQHFNFLELDKLKADLDRLKAQIDEIGIPEAQRTVNEVGITLWDEYIQVKKDWSELKQIMDANGFSKDVVRDAYLQNRDRFKADEELYDQLVREDLKLLNQKDVGIVSDEEFAKLSSKEGYASLKRKFYDEIVGDEQVPGKGVGGARPGSLKARTGSSRAIIAPVYSGIKNHAEVLRKALKQVVYNKIVNMALKGKHPALFQRQQIQAMKDPNTGRMIFPQERDPNIVMGRINGKRVAFLTDSYIRKTMDEILNYQNVGLFEKLLQASSRFFTKGTTGLFPGFTITNYTIDQITALAQTQHKYAPIYSPIKELFKVITDKSTPEAKFFEEYMVAGGERQTFVGWQDLSARELAQKVAQERTGLLKVADWINSGADILAIPQKYSEIATRAVEYIKSRKAGNPTVVALEQAGRVTAPFHHIGRLGGGRFGKTLVKSIPFFNPLLQVFGQTYRSGFRSGPKAQQRMLWVLLALTAANVASFGLVNLLGTKEQKELYKDLEPEELSANIWLPSVDGKTLVKLRMPNQLNQFGTLINMAIADQILNTKYNIGDYVAAGTSFLPTQFNLLKPAEALFSWIPQLVKPAIMTAANIRDFPTIRPLESQSQQYKEPGKRSTPSTPFLTKKLGEQLNISPIKLDFLIQGYFGRATGFITGKPGVYNPFSTLFRESYFESGRRLQTFYDQKTQNDQQYNTLKNNPDSLTPTERGEILNKRAKLNALNALVDEYRDTPDGDETRLSNLRDAILKSIDTL